VAGGLDRLIDLAQMLFDFAEDLERKPGTRKLSLLLARAAAYPTRQGLSNMKCTLLRGACLLRREYPSVRHGWGFLGRSSE
jgi:hypothetical protein